MHARTLAASVALALATPGLLAPARADSLIHEIKVGVLAHDVPDLWSGFRAEQNSADVNIEALLSPASLFLGGTLHPAVGGSISTDGGTSHGYVDARWKYETPSGVFFATGLGAAIHDGQLELEDPNRKALGSRVLFHIPFEVGLRFDAHNSLSAYFEHTSNAFIVSPNEGFDRLGIRYGYRF